MVQHTSPAQTPEVENTTAETTNSCCHHWVIQPADGPISSGSCQVCGEIREFKNYVESATWGDSRTTGKGAQSSTGSESTSDDQDTAGPEFRGDEPVADNSDTASEE